MSEPLGPALAQLRELIGDADRLVRAVASGRRRGETPECVKTELRPVKLKTETKLQLTRHDDGLPTVSNIDFDSPQLDALLEQPYGNWLVETVDSTVQLRVTKRGAAQVHRSVASREQDLDHDRASRHLMPADDPLFTAVGADAAKRRQVDAFLQAADPLLHDGDASLRVADLGCGNAYLTFAMYRHLTRSGRGAQVLGVDVRDKQRRRNTALAAQLDCAQEVQFVAGSIADAPLPEVDMVLALHACDTATDDALARGVAAGAEHILAAPCCHHDVAAQLRRTASPFPTLTRDGIVRERFADVLTDALRASLLRLHGYRVDVVEFVDSKHTPRNTLLRATRTGAAADPLQQQEYDTLTRQWQVRPRLEELLRGAR